MKLVPCRWSRTGWKYVESDPKEHKFFSNPNRVNSHGVQKKEAARAKYVRSPENDTFRTTNEHFYASDK